MLALLDQAGPFVADEAEAAIAKAATERLRTVAWPAPMRCTGNGDHMFKPALLPTEPQRGSVVKLAFLGMWLILVSY